MRTPNIDEGQYAWIVLALYIITYDIIAITKGKRTLSTAFYTATNRMSRKIILATFWAYLTAHLFRWLPKKYDLFRRFLETSD